MWGPFLWCGWARRGLVAVVQAVEGEVVGVQAAGGTAVVVVAGRSAGGGWQAARELPAALADLCYTYGSRSTISQGSG